MAYFETLMYCHATRHEVSLCEKRQMTAVEAVKKIVYFLFKFGGSLQSKEGAVEIHSPGLYNNFIDILRVGGEGEELDILHRLARLYGSELSDMKAWLKEHEASKEEIAFAQRVYYKKDSRVSLVHAFALAAGITTKEEIELLLSLVQPKHENPLERVWEVLEMYIEHGDLPSETIAVCNG